MEWRETAGISEKKHNAALVGQNVKGIVFTDLLTWIKVMYFQGFVEVVLAGENADLGSLFGG